MLLAIVFAPLAFSGASWDASRGWISKWAMFVIALICSKLVLVVMFLVAITQVSAPIDGDLASVADPIAGIVLMAVGIGLLLARTTDAASPFWDSANTALALSAQYWQARRRVETWLFWILVNIGSVGLYATQSLWFTSCVYAVLLLVALYGWREWRQAQKGV